MVLGQKGHRAPAGTRLPSPAEPSRVPTRGHVPSDARYGFLQRLHDRLQTETPTGRQDPPLEGTGPGGRWDSGPADVFPASLKMTQETDNSLAYKITCSLVPFGPEENPHCI